MYYNYTIIIFTFVMNVVHNNRAVYNQWNGMVEWNTGTSDLQLVAFIDNWIFNRDNYQEDAKVAICAVLWNVNSLYLTM